MREPAYMYKYGRKRLTFIALLLAAACLSAPAEADIQGSAPGAPPYDSKDKRDPFIPLITRKVKVAAGLENVQAAEDIVLEGIVWEPCGVSVAILNGVIVREGEVIGAVTIKNIERMAVELYIDKIMHIIALSEEGE